ncbi:hypothetical protein Gogos_000128 [Gossypium gossypioides]|uniref:RNase H type-1 domain-containing protein n=1 Tax=Gossypium gossypioides TaxID=34282 RepID=A0A7J9D2X1_GOSGO|nr:hypothetical protein [Gossypium gossypioides]
MNRNYRIQEDIPRVTIYFDAAFDSRNFKSAIGLVGWDLRGELLVLNSIIHNNISSPFAAEAYACLEDKSVIGAIIRDIQNKKPCFQEIIFQHIHRSGNSHAHRLAKDALDRGETFYLMGEELKHHIFASERRWPRNPD